MTCRPLFLFYSAVRFKWRHVKNHKELQNARLCYFTIQNAGSTVIPRYPGNWFQPPHTKIHGHSSPLYKLAEYSRLSVYTGLASQIQWADCTRCSWDSQLPPHLALQMPARQGAPCPPQTLARGWERWLTQPNRGRDRAQPSPLWDALWCLLLPGRTGCEFMAGPPIHPLLFGDPFCFPCVILYLLLLPGAQFSWAPELGQMAFSVFKSVKEILKMKQAPFLQINEQIKN